MEHAETPRQRVWQVGALCRAVADTLEARFGYVTVRGELSGFSRAASGHCYFSLKDSTGQLRCALFRRAASQLGWMPRDGELVEVQARITVYEGRGDLQLIVERMQRAGQGALYEDFLRRKAALEAQGLFDPPPFQPAPVSTPDWAVETPVPDRTPASVPGAMNLYAVYALILFAVPTLGVSAVIGLLAVTGREPPADPVAPSRRRRTTGGASSPS